MKKGCEQVPGVTAEIFQVPELLPTEVLAKMHAASFPYPIISAAKMTEADGFIFGIPTRYGRAVSSISSFFDSTGGLWASQGLAGKFAATFFSTSSQGGGQETTSLTTIPFFAHQGMIFVPLGYGCKSLMDMSEIHGGSPYGAGTFSGGDGARQPTELEKGVAVYQGKNFAGIVAQFDRGKQ